MTTIEERANAYALETIEANKNPKYDRPFAEFVAQTEKNAYIKGATEQREIDIQRAVEWLKGNAAKYIFITHPKYGSYCDILTYIDNKMYDYFTQAMKGGEQ